MITPEAILRRAEELVAENAHHPEVSQTSIDMRSAFDETMQDVFVTTSTASKLSKPLGSEHNQDKPKPRLDDMPLEILLTILDQLILETAEIRSTYDCGKWQVQYSHMPFRELCLVSKLIASVTQQVMCSRRPTLRLDIPPTFLGFDQTLGFGSGAFNHIAPPLLQIPKYLASETRLHDLQQMMYTTLSKIGRDRDHWPREYPWAYVSMAVAWDEDDNIYCSRECWVANLAIRERVIEERETERLRELASNST
jgi:hypothetical protein